jgi:hypothetical protein
MNDYPVVGEIIIGNGSPPAERETILETTRQIIDIINGVGAPLAYSVLASVVGSYVTKTGPQLLERLQYDMATVLALRHPEGSA